MFNLVEPSAQNISELEKVRKACLNYIEGFYEGDTAKIIKVMKPSVYKIGFWKNTGGLYEFDGQMTFHQAINYAKKVRLNRSFAKTSDPKDVLVLDISDHIAAAKITAWWGEDYILLSKKGEEWMIEQILWQGPLNKQFAKTEKSEIHPGLFAKSLSPKDSLIVYETGKHLKELIKNDKFSGVVLIGKRDSVLLMASFGEASKEYNVPNNENTAFNLASMTKMFTGVAVAQLVEDGKLKFNDSIHKYLAVLPSNLTNGITVHHLLTHTSGLGSYWTDEFQNSNHAAYRSLNDYIKFIKNEKPAFSPGTNWSYSNTGYLLLGLIIEKVSGMSYFNYVKKYIFEKAGMKNADFYEADRPNKSVATAYSKMNRYVNDSTKYSIPVFIAPVKGSSAGGAYASAIDLFKFSDFLINGRLIIKVSTQLIISGKLSYGQPSQKKKYAYGFANQIVNGKLIVFHDGGANGISTVMDIYPDSGYTVIVLSNYDPPAAWTVMTRIRELITN